jgi:iron complex transport system substrate-binding protein
MIVGMHSSSLSAVKDGIMQKMFPELLTKETGFIKQGFEPNIEELLKLEPDLIVQWANRGSEIIDPIEQTGITTLGLNYGSQSELEDWMSIFGQISDQPERAQELIDYHRQMLARVQTAVKDLAEEEKPRVLYLSPVDNLRAFGSGTYNNEYFGWTGAVNVAADVKEIQPVTMEQIIAWDPEIIYIGNFSSHLPDDIMDGKLDGQDFSSTSAVKNGRVYKVPLGGYRWDPPNQESPLMWMWLLSVQHPELIEFDLRQEMKDFYLTWYGYNLSEEEVDQILRCEVNVGLSACFDDNSKL